MFNYRDDIELEGNYEDIIKEIDDIYPIKIKSLQPLLDRVHEEYPYASKLEIFLVVKTFWQGFREQLIYGKLISIKKYVKKFQMYIKFLTNSETPFPYVAFKMFKGKKKIKYKYWKV